MKKTAHKPQLVAPVLVTQLNCEAVIGVNERRYLETVLPLCKGHVIEIGKLRAVPVDVLLEKERAGRARRRAIERPRSRVADRGRSACGSWAPEERVTRTALPLVWDRLARHEVDTIIAIQGELQQSRGGRRVLRHTARVLGVTVPTLDRVMMNWRRCRASTIARVRAAIAEHAGQCFKHDDCASFPAVGRACFAERTAP